MEEPGHDIGRPDRDYPERGLPPHQALGDMVDQTVSTHGDHHGGSLISRFSSVVFRFLGGRRPNRLYVVGPGECRHDIPMGAPGELRCHGVGDDDDAVHAPWSVPLYAPGLMSDRPIADLEAAEQSTPLFSLVSGEGDGFLLGLAAGDAAGGAWDLGYSAVTEQAAVISYQLIEHRTIDPKLVVGALTELDGADGGESVLRAETPGLRSWLNEAATGTPGPSKTPGLDNLARTPPVGAAFRRSVEGLVENSIALSQVFSVDASSVAVGLIGASAVAAAAFGQSGRDLVKGVGEAVIDAVSSIGDGMEGTARLETLEKELSDAAEHVGATSGDEVLEALDGDPDDPLTLALAGILLAAPVTDRPHTAVEEAARIGGSVLGAFVGAVAGARVGIRAWPWPFANDTWFAEIGRRVIRGPDEVRDLPIPYAVEQHLMSGERPGFH